MPIGIAQKLLLISRAAGGAAAPTAPSDLTATADGGKQRIDLAWTDNSSDETGFYIERSSDAGTTWTWMTSVAANTTGYTDTNLIPGTTYHYRVRAYNGDGESSYSNTANDTVFDFSDVTGLILDINPDIGFWPDSGKTNIARDGGDVGYIEDQSGNNNHFEQTTAASKPHLNAGALNGHNILQFDGSDDYLESTTGNFNSTSEGAIFAVYRLRSSLQDTQYLFASADEATANYLWAAFAYEDSVDPNIRLDQKNNDTIDALRGDTDLIADTLNTAIYRSDGTTTALRLNGVDQSITAAAGANNGDWTGDTSNRDNFTIGALKRTSVGGYAFIDLARIVFYSAEPTSAEITKIEEALNDLYREETRTELFIDAKAILSATASRSINTPTKYGSNPILESGTNNATWDYGKFYNAIHLIDSSWYMWYLSHEFDSPNDDYSCYATSADGLTWTKPNLGLETYDGDTNNNIILPADVKVTDLYYDEYGTDSRKYVLLAEHDSTITGIYIYTSSDGYNFSLAKEVTDATAYGETIEGKAITRLKDGRWIVYFVAGHASSDREIGAFVSDTDDLAGSWTEVTGLVILTGASTAQKYDIGLLRVDNHLVSFLGIFNSTSNQIISRMYSSRSGKHFTNESGAGEWISLGSATEWDDEMAFSVKNLVHSGNNWLAYYIGSPEDHSTARPVDRRIGRASIGYRRIGQYGTTGNVVTYEITPDTGDKLYINADASGGTLEIEVLDAIDDSVMTNYAQADFDDITTDTYETEATWGGSSLPTGQAIKLKFYLTTDVKLYSYEVR